jgi:hypothetical protein
MVKGTGKPRKQQGKGSGSAMKRKVTQSSSNRGLGNSESNRSKKARATIYTSDSPSSDSSESIDGVEGNEETSTSVVVDGLDESTPLGSRRSSRIPTRKPAKHDEEKDDEEDHHQHESSASEADEAEDEGEDEDDSDEEDGMGKNRGGEPNSKERKGKSPRKSLQERKLAARKMTEAIKEKMPVLAWALEGPLVEMSLSREFSFTKSTDVKLSFMGVDVDASCKGVTQEEVERMTGPGQQEAYEALSSKRFILYINASMAFPAVTKIKAMMLEAKVSDPDIYITTGRTTFKDLENQEGGEKLSRVILSEDKLWRVSFSSRLLKKAGGLLFAMACGGFVFVYKKRVLFIGDSLIHPFNPEYVISDEERPREAPREKVSRPLKTDVTILIQRKIEELEAKTKLENWNVKAFGIDLRRYEEGGTIMSQADLEIRTGQSKAKIEMSQVIAKNGALEIRELKDLLERVKKGDDVRFP